MFRAMKRLRLKNEIKISKFSQKYNVIIEIGYYGLTKKKGFFIIKLRT